MTGGRWVAIGIVVVLLGLGGLAFWFKSAQEAKELEALDEYELTPAEFHLLPENKKQRYRDQRIELPLPQDWGGGLFSTDAGGWDNVYEKAVHTGTLDPLMAQYNRAVFEMAHPRIRAEFIPWDMWGRDYKSQLLVAMQAGRAPVVSVARDWQANIKNGLYADITELVGGEQWINDARLVDDKAWLARHPNVWRNFHRQPALAKRMGMRDGRIYIVTQQKVTAEVITYRKDWYRWVAEKRGWDRQPVGTVCDAAGTRALCGPDQNPWGVWGPHPRWHIEDFLALMGAFTEEAELIAANEVERYMPVEKIPTDPAEKKKVIDLKAADIRGLSAMMGPFGRSERELYVPDLSGKYTWRFIGTKSEQLIDSIVESYLLLNEKKWVHSSARQDWADMGIDFENSKAGMIRWLTHLVANAVQSKKYVFGQRTEYKDVVGMVPPPLNDYDFRTIQPDANIFAFNPLMAEQRMTSVRDRKRMGELRQAKLRDNGEQILKNLRGMLAKLDGLKKGLVADPLTGEVLAESTIPGDLVLSWAFAERPAFPPKKAIEDALAAEKDAKLKAILQRLIDRVMSQPDRWEAEEAKLAALVEEVVKPARPDLDALKKRLLTIADRFEAEPYPQLWITAEEGSDDYTSAMDELEAQRNTLRKTLRPDPEDVANDRQTPIETLRFQTAEDLVATNDMVKSLLATVKSVHEAAPTAKVADPLTGKDPAALNLADRKDAALLLKIADRLAYETTADLPSWLTAVDPGQRRAALEALWDGHEVMWLMARRRDIRLRAAFDWTESLYYGRMFVERIRVSQVKADYLSQGFELPNMLLTMPFKPTGEAADLFRQVDLAKYFPRDYIETHEVIKTEGDIPPLYHEFGLTDPGEKVRAETINELFAEVLAVSVSAGGEQELRREVRNMAVAAIDTYATKINKELEAIKDEDDREKLSAYWTAWAKFFAERPRYRKYYEQVAKPFCEKFCKGLVDLSMIRPAAPASAPAGAP